MQLKNNNTVKLTIKAVMLTSLIYAYIYKMELNLIPLTTITTHMLSSHIPGVYPVLSFLLSSYSHVFRYLPYKPTPARSQHPPIHYPSIY